MREVTTTDVLISGAGAAGLTLAIHLARCGVSFKLIEKMREPFRGSRGKGIQPRTQEIFEDLGIIDSIVARGGVYPGVREYRRDGSHTDSEVAEPTAPTPAEPYHMALMIPQFLTEQVMREKLIELGHEVEFGRELVGFEQDSDGVSARISEDGREVHIRARHLIGADGGRSFVRQMLDIDFPGKTLGMRAVVADVMLTGLARDAWHRFGDGPTQLGVCPLAGTESFQIQAPVPLEGDIDLSAAGLEALVAERSGRNDIHVESVSWASVYNMNARLADRYRVGRALLVGDAAHIHPPTGGQGLNTSVQDAYNLGWKLAAVIGGGSLALLDTYEAERRPIAEGVLGLSTKLLDAAKRGEVRRGREVHQLDIGYRNSSLALTRLNRESKIIAGDRAPDAPIRGAGGQPRRVFDLLAGPHWTLIGYEVDRDRVPSRRGLRIHTFGARGDLIDERGDFKLAYGLEPGEWVLVRPDKYIGAIVCSTELAALDGYLSALQRSPSPASSATTRLSSHVGPAS